MFTGIVETWSELTAVTQNQNNLTFTFKSPIAKELKVDQSVAHNGVCLTVESCNQESYNVTAIHETLKKTNLKHLKVGDKVNIERCLKADARLDGHFVQGHVDQTGTLINIEDQAGSWLLTIVHEPRPGNITIEKGSITVNGISLTVVESTPDMFTVAIIPYTWHNTNLSALKEGDLVNLEFDVLGKYIFKLVFQHNLPHD